MSLYPLASSTWDEAELQAMQRVIASGMFTMGGQVAAFERAFADYLNVKFSVMVNSGSSANLLMVAALFYLKHDQLKRGDEVIVPAVSWSTTYYPLYQYGLKLKFVDIDPETLNFDLAQLAEAVGDQTRAILAVNLLGNPNDFDAIKSIIGGRDIYLLEDNCESLGATYKGRQAGTFGVMGSFSSFFSHHISTMEGGMIATDDETLYHILLSLRAHGWTRNLPKVNRVTGEKSSVPFEESFRFVLPGYNVRPLELSGAIGVEQIKKLPGLVQARRDNAKAFQAMMTRFPHFQIQKEIGRSSWFGFSLVVKADAPFNRQTVIDQLEQHEIEYRPIVTGNFAKNEVVQWFDHSIHGELSHANHIDTHGLFVGNHHYPLDKQLAVLASALSALPQ